MHWILCHLWNSWTIIDFWVLKHSSLDKLFKNPQYQVTDLNSFSLKQINIWNETGFESLNIFHIHWDMERNLTLLIRLKFPNHLLNWTFQLVYKQLSSNYAHELLNFSLRNCFIFHRHSIILVFFLPLQVILKKSRG